MEPDKEHVPAPILLDYRTPSVEAKRGTSLATRIIAAVAGMFFIYALLFLVMGMVSRGSDFLPAMAVDGLGVLMMFYVASAGLRKDGSS